MERTSVQKLARVLRVMVIVLFAYNILALYFVPTLAMMQEESLWDGQTMEQLLSEDPGFWLNFSLRAWNPVMWMLAAAVGGSYWLLLTLFLLLCGVCTANILWQGKRVLDTILAGEPFSIKNAANLNRAAAYCFIISGASLVRLIFALVWNRTIWPLLTYNALFVPVFLVGGLLFLVMSALFRQAAELKAENDLTI